MARTGRPRLFDRDEAVHKAMALFWQYGYESTSLAQLREAMGGISAASFYAAFSSKESLFDEAIQLYLDTSGEQLRNILRDPTLDTATAISTALKSALTKQTESNHPSGCMVVLSATNCSPHNQHIQQTMAKEREQTRLAFQDCIQRGIGACFLSAGTDAESLSLFFSTLLNGISIQARDGLNLDKLNTLIDSTVSQLLAHAR
ncbi:MAG: TetR/AcrR family transcriptional regulator [Alcaligenaceae bacterium]|jgi:TetR/AcrR family transcriptional repressor for divergent bdcA|nr:TetR/AcrR family transcriptional regulator [Alcaligenaceae bacterium]